MRFIDGNRLKNKKKVGAIFMAIGQLELLQVMDAASKLVVK